MSCPNGHRDPIYVNPTDAECAVCGVRYDAESGAAVRTIVDVDPIACRTRWHAGPCEVITYSDGTREHMTHGELSDQHHVWTCPQKGCGGR